MPISIQRDGRGYRLETELRLARPRDEVFEFFSNAANLQAITPDSLHFRILTPQPIEMRAGALIDYRLRVHGVPIRWRTEITAWEPPVRFEDVQARGPYRWWIHEHTFEAVGDDTVMRDRVRYGVPGGALVNRLVVSRDVRRIFEHRAKVIREWAAGGRRSAVAEEPATADRSPTPPS